MIMKHFIAFLFFLSSIIVYSQDISYKFGDVSKEELLMDSCDFYSDADAMVLFNKGYLEIDYEKPMGIVYVFVIHQRIKILTNEGKKYANRKIKYFKGKVKSQDDIIRGFKAYTYNLEGNKIKKTKLSKKEKYKNELSDYNQEMSFVMPNVKKGSILEIKYTLVSTNLGTLRKWYFQDEIPVKYSNFWYVVPEFLKYQVNNYGNYFPKEIKSKYKNVLIYSELLNEQGHEYIMKNITPLEQEPFMGDNSNALSRIEFNLVKIESSYSGINDIGTTYEKLNENLVKSYLFGKRLSKGGFSKKWKQELIGKSDYEKLEFLLNKIQENTNWNKHYHFLSEISGKTLYKRKEGDIADINLTLVAALKYHGLKAFPVILRTRDKGIPNPLYPDKWSFNYVIALVQIDGKDILCDATLNAPPGIIRQECLNNNGWLVDKDGGRWVDLTKDAFNTVSTMYTAKIKDDYIYYTIIIQLKDYIANDKYKEYKNGELEQELEETFSDWEIDSMSFDKSNSNKVFKIKLNIKKEIDDEQMIMVDPFIIYSLKENPFKRETRNSNIDFVFKSNNNMVFSMEVPEEYNIELPENIQIKTEDNSIIYRYRVMKNSNKITAINKMKFNKTVFSPQEYGVLKAFYEKMLSSNNNVIILRKM